MEEESFYRDQTTQSNQEVRVTDSRELHEPQLNPRFLQYEYVSEVAEVPVFTSDAVSFPLNANPGYLRNLEKIKESDTQFARYTKLILMAGTDRALLDLIINGISTGLSHGTMDVIYRVGVGRK